MTTSMQFRLLFCLALVTLSIPSHSFCDGLALGWSSDGSKWAFLEEGDFGEGAMVDERFSINIIDTRANTFFKRLKFNVTEESDNYEAELVKQKAFKAEKLVEVRNMGITLENGTVVYESKPYHRENYSHIEQFGKTLVAFESSGDRFEVKLEGTFFKGEERINISAEEAENANWAELVKSRFTVSCRRNGGEWKILQSDKEPWRRLQTYRIQHISLSPSKKEIAILIEGIAAGFENHKTPFYLGVTGVLP